MERLQERIPAETATLDAASPADLRRLLSGRDAVISALSYAHNRAVAEAAVELGVSYFDLTEDVATTRAVAALATGLRPTQTLMPQCGLAPGFISIVAAHLARQFERLDSVRMRVGALPTFPSNMLKYNLTWSTDGLINEYCNPCETIHDGQPHAALPLEGLEEFSLDGIRYEAFHTSGGLGTLCQSLAGQVRELNYKTIRYPGHRDLMQFLLGELRLRERRELLREILERAVPVTFQDVVVTFCTVTGERRGQFVQLTDARKIYSQEIAGEMWSAIQITTASSVCAMLDLWSAGRLPTGRFVRQEEAPLDEFLSNRFGRPFDVVPTPQVVRPVD